MNSKRFFKIAVVALILCTLTFTPVQFGYAAGSAAYTGGAKVAGFTTSYVTLNMNAGTKPVLLTAGSNMCSAAAVADMARAAGCIAAINGTYFSAYDGNPIPWGTLIKDGKVLHISNGGSVVGFTSDGKLVMDRLTFDFSGYINGEYRSIPWRINHPSIEADAITIFTSEYGVPVKMQPGAKAPVVENGLVTYIATSDFTVPAGGFAIAYNPSVAYLVDERFAVGDSVSYDVAINTTFTSPSDWEDVVIAAGAGPSLIINGNVTADGAAELFTEAKINTNKSGRSFIGADAAGNVKIGNIGNANLKDAAAVCQALGLVNAMCLDGGGSIALYYNGKAMTAGRNVNNAIGFIGTAADNTSGNANQPAKATIVKANKGKINLDGADMTLSCFNISGNNYFKLRDIAMLMNGTDKNFEVTWDDAKKSINLLSNSAYTTVGGELADDDGTGKQLRPGNGSIYKDGQPISMTCYNIGGNNYFKLRDVTAQFDIGVDYDAATKTILLTTANEL